MFSELYSTYYNTVAKLLDSAVRGELDKKRMQDIITNYAFSESLWHISDAVSDERWKLLKRDLTTPIKHSPKMPLTLLQKRWLKSVTLDIRFRLFDVDIDGLQDVEPLFTDEDYCIFDKYSDGDPYEDEFYVKNFRLVLDAVINKYPLTVVAKTRYGRIQRTNVLPCSLEYSEKDDKFRLIAQSDGCKATINLARIQSWERYLGNKLTAFYHKQDEKRELTLSVSDERNALERVMLHFAHFEKNVQALDNDRYLVNIKYDSEDETEMVIRVLSFGKFVKVTEPQSFAELVKQRIQKQFANFFP